MRTAIAAKLDEISPTLGGTTEFVLLSGERQERLSCTEKIPAFLKKHRVEILICGGIGNCMLDLLGAMQVKVIPGVAGELAEVIRQFQAGELKSGEKYSCADHGRTCGSCPGTF